MSANPKAWTLLHVKNWQALPLQNSPTK